ncbi:MAG: hypothetical protein HRT41_12910 [Campylobacteraceae bacterium]|nr:hypothetical protein [Campylobacteraceae bacterium]
MSVDEGNKIQRFRKKLPNAQTNWSMINNMRTVNMLDGLIRKESVSQLLNNYGFSKITNPIPEIRNEIGFDSILNYKIPGLRCEEYRLIDSDITREKVEILKQKILKHIIKKECK